MSTTKISIYSAHSSTSDVISGYPEEDLRPGGRHNRGYFPAWLGMQLEDGKFIIMRKLGWGMYSSVWLAQDQKSERFVAIKILTCEATQALERQKSDEIAMLQKVAQTDRSHKGSRHVVEFYETFDMAGPHGLHRCIVTEPLGLTIDHLRKEFGDARLDLKFDNIMLRPDSINFCVAATLASDPSKAYCFDTSKPPSIIPIESQTIRIWGRPLEPEEVRLDAVVVDLGHSHWVDRHFQERIQPMALRAPEVILGYPWNGSADVWNLGCLLIELLTGGWLFEANATDDWDREEDHLVRMTQSLEEQFPLDFLQKCEKRDTYFKEDGTWAHFTEHPEPGWPLRKILETFSKFADDEGEIDAAVKFLKRCLRLRPEDRATPRELVDDPWFAFATSS